MIVQLNEASAKDLITKSKSSYKGKQRYSKRVRSKVATSSRDYNSLNMDKLFKDGICTVNIRVQGETDTYIVTIKFGGFLDLLHTQMKTNNNKCDLRTITRALVNGFNQEDVYIHCTCPDATYRFNYWQTKNNINSGAKENRPSNITNPHDTLGSGCKHSLLVLNNNAWIIKVATVIFNYVNYMQKTRESLYAKIIFPAIYQKEYDRDYQLSLFDDDGLDKDEKDIDKAMVHKGRDERGRFNKENEYQFKKKEIEIDDNPDQLKVNYPRP